MDELLRRLNSSAVRYLLVGGQAMRLAGLPRFSMDLDFYLPPRDLPNLTRLNTLLDAGPDAPLVPLGPRGKNFARKSGISS